jgi:hypothetical protein
VITRLLQRVVVGVLVALILGVFSRVASAAEPATVETATVAAVVELGPESVGLVGTAAAVIVALQAAALVAVLGRR